MLIPSLALVITGTTFAGVQISDGISARDWSKNLSLQVDPAVGLATAAQNERTYSLLAIGDDPQGLADLPARRNESDAALKKIADIAPVLEKLNPEATAKSSPIFRAMAAQQQAIRHAVDIRQATAAEIDDFYTQLAGVVAIGLESTARTSANPGTVAEEIVAADLMRITDLHTRGFGRAAGVLAGGSVLSPPDRLLYARSVGALHSQLAATVPQLTATEKARYEKLLASDEWRSTVAAEDVLAQTGRLPMPVDEWLAAQHRVSSELRGLARDHFGYAERGTVDSAEAQLAQGIAAGIAMLVVAVVSFVIAIQLARTLVRRLRSLRAKTLELADQALPSMVQRLHDGQKVDVDAELVIVDDGVDEIGQVAEAFNTAQRTAVAAAAAEARTRGGINRVFMDIARRSQVVVHQQLGVLDTAEAKQNDPEHLELLFQLDHLATRARRNAENLLILGGGQPGRKWRKPVALEEIVRSAISETRDFTRVSAVRLPEVRVVGAAVADLVHLLAELIDNAASFSPPDSPVSVRGNLVGKGVVVEVEDQGLGIHFEERERLNDLLRESPDFQEMALAGHRHLGLFVIGQLAQRHGIAVNLLESAYGGIKAIALIPAKLLDSVEEAGPRTAEHTPADVRSGGRHHRPPFTPQSVADPVPRMPGNDFRHLPPWPAEPAGVEALPSTPLPAGGRGPQSVGGVDRPSSTNRRKKAPLPRRQRQSHLAPQLRVENTEPPNSVSPTRIPRRRTPDEARNAMASFQRGTHEARNSDVSPIDGNGWSRNE
ncbi:HAMP domain-containing protein [Nocardia sp. NBC_00881]|uniref:sensor histidine kinase n=1 Tax=Nocardia sp. NBC_00881 TaxID=2975995 RepID=UPI0038697721|nr:HAMP domain-containing protein [Nocardia sp. NBC_00881]